MEAAEGMFRYELETVVLKKPEKNVIKMKITSEMMPLWCIFKDPSHTYTCSWLQQNVKVINSLLTQHHHHLVHDNFFPFLDVIYSSAYSPHHHTENSHLQGTISSSDANAETLITTWPLICDCSLEMCNHL